MMKRILLTSFAAIGLIAVTSQSASAQPGWGHHRPGYYGYYGYGRPMIVPPPVVIGPGYGPGYVVGPPPPVYVAPAPVVVPPPPPAYVPSYTYGAVGPRGFGFGYASPGFGVYVGR